MEYAANVASFISAIHAVNPNAKMCPIVTTPGFWPDGVTNSEYPQPWNQTVLSALNIGQNRPQATERAQADREASGMTFIA